ncbi:hypothetical protein [Hydrogenophaga sp. PBL-H3]|uniref:hypothetical protein n=1 Tax=Hydrogenophaga sp. PBL-H3 TaxID=434010 RepID=UPI00131FAE62|nr:hypothetical protein [Hydrogenophaga sp. PBL-H3]QHE75057.1 hypothetical protein F9Z45_02800 [Hydrogenophaga sp. PBL-H3]QHE79484.1 hypothetical protein F9Z44_02800 [Hydrogenophaga sp. PBL-H3]
MDALILVMLAASGLWFLRSNEQRRRIALLGSFLGKYQIEVLMENLTQGYLRALGEDDPARREQILNMLNAAEQSVAQQFGSFAAEFSRLDEAQTRVSTLRVALPFADRLFPKATFDVREAFRVHARGLADAARNDLNRSPRDKAYTMSAELLLMQHTCHWFCRSLTTASARTLVRHQTPYAQLVASVGPATRRDYEALVRG